MFRSALMLLIPVVVCVADSAVMFEFPDGITVAMISNGDVSMAAESVFIEPSGGNYDDGWLPNMTVRCLFELVNNTDEEQYVTVGFPFDAKYGNSYTAMDEEMLVEELNRSFADEFRPAWETESIIRGMDAIDDIPEELDFRTFINGVETEVYYRKCALSLEEGFIWRPVVAVWKMKFEPNETIMLENTYNTCWDYFGGGPWSSSSVNYILTSGGTWSGPIGDAVVVLTLPEEIHDPCLNDTLLSYWHWTGTPVIDGRTITWHYTDFEPHENISFTGEEGIQLGFWENALNPERMYNTISWTEEDLLRSAGEYLNDGNFWGIQADTRLTLRIVEALPWAMQGSQAPNGIDVDYFYISQSSSEPVITPEMEERIDLVRSLQEQMQRNLESAGRSGYLEFLPMFVSRFTWDVDALDMYSSMPAKNAKYLDLLENLERAAEGQYIDNPEIRSFYELTGWYSYGNESGISPLSERAVAEYLRGL